MQDKRIIHFDTLYATKNDSNPFNSSFILSQTLNRVSRISLKSIEIPISNHNLRTPYSTISLKYNKPETNVLVSGFKLIPPR